MRNEKGNGFGTRTSVDISTVVSAVMVSCARRVYATMA